MDLHLSGFSLLEGMGSPPTSRKYAHSFPTWKKNLPPVDSPPTKFLFPPPTKSQSPQLSNNFQVITQ